MLEVIKLLLVVYAKAVERHVLFNWYCTGLFVSSVSLIRDVHQYWASIVVVWRIHLTGWTGFQFPVRTDFRSYALCSLLDDWSCYESKYECSAVCQWHFRGSISWCIVSCWHCWMWTSNSAIVALFMKWDAIFYLSPLWKLDNWLLHLIDFCT